MFPKSKGLLLLLFVLFILSFKDSVSLFRPCGPQTHSISVSASQMRDYRCIVPRPACECVWVCVYTH